MTYRIRIPRAPASPNHRGTTLRARLALLKAERERAYLAACSTRNAHAWPRITGPARITWTVYRHRLLDPMVNLPASLKHYQDGLCRALLPLGDGPGTPYTWEAPTQVKIPADEDEAVTVTITTPEARDDAEP